MKRIKKVIGYNLENFSRFFLRHYISFKCMLHFSTIRKAQHVKGIKYFKIGKNVSIDSFSRIDIYKSGNENPLFKIGDNVMISFNFTALVTANLYIEDNVLIASNVLITTENHGIDPEQGNYLNQNLISNSVCIKRNVWIGEKVVVLPGVTIGEFSVIGAGSIVTKSIPPYSIACGNPACVIKKYNFETHQWEKV